MKFNSINSHLWRTQWAMGTELDPGWQGGWAPGASPGTLQRKGAPGHAARTPSPETKGQRKFLGRSPFEMTSLAGKLKGRTRQGGGPVKTVASKTWKGRLRS